MGRFIELAASDAFRLPAYRADPAGTPRGGLVVAQEIFGINAHIRGVCDGFAADGFVAIAPALFERAARGVDLGYMPGDIAKGRELKAKVDLDAVLRDVAAARDAAATGGKVAIVGYCWGGYVAWMSAARVNGLAAAVSYYGGGMLEAVGEMPRCPVMAHFGERDAGLPIARVREFMAAHPEAEIFVYPADHGFNCDARASFDAAAARLARERTLDFLGRHAG
jgi:carboxymethylenebutenolidase